MAELLREQLYYCTHYLEWAERIGKDFSKNPKFMDELHRVALKEDKLREREWK